MKKYKIALLILLISLMLTAFIKDDWQIGLKSGEYKEVYCLDGSPIVYYSGHGRIAAHCP